MYCLVFNNKYSYSYLTGAHSAWRASPWWGCRGCACHCAAWASTPRTPWPFPLRWRGTAATAKNLAKNFSHQKKFPVKNISVIKKRVLTRIFTNQKKCPDRNFYSSKKVSWQKFSLIKKSFLTQIFTHKKSVQTEIIQWPKSFVK